MVEPAGDGSQARPAPPPGGVKAGWQVRLGVATLMILSVGGVLWATLATSLTTPEGPGLGAIQASITQVPGFVRELRDLHVRLKDGTLVTLEALVTRPDDKQGRLPLVLLSHTSPGTGSGRAAATPTAFAAQSMAFARRGYAAVAVMRRGFGKSQGPLVENAGRCNNPNYLAAGRASAEDLLVSLQALATEDWVDPDRILLVGASAGGFVSLAAAATNPHGVLGVISFAGGDGGAKCHRERLVTAVAKLGERAHVPSLWVYAENDQEFTPAFGHEMADAYGAQGAPVDFVTAPPFAEDGHPLFMLAPTDVWWPQVEPFLAKLALPTEIIHPAAPSDLRPPPRLVKDGAEKFAEFAASERFEKAFAVSPKGKWSWVGGRRTRDDAIEDALTSCRERGGECSLYAVGNEYAPGAQPAK